MEKNSLLHNINTLSREFSTSTVLLHQSIAHMAGLSGTDHKYIDLLLEHGSMTAGKLAELSGLTTGAVTGVIDRLEKLELVSREKDIQDRRKVVVVLNTEEAFKRIGPAFEAMKEDLEVFYDDFTEAELLAIEKYLRSVNIFTKKQISKINAKKL